jgi:hypothetical protein
MFTKLPFNSKLYIFLLIIVINFLKCNSEIDKIADNNVFLKYLFQKYGSDHNLLTFEGLEHLLENLNLGKKFNDCGVYACVFEIQNYLVS